MKIQKDTQRNLQKNAGSAAPNMAGAQRMNYASVSPCWKCGKLSHFAVKCHSKKKNDKDSANLS